MKEKPKHVEAFRYYFALVESNHSATEAVKLTAEHAGVIVRTIWKWHKEFNWENRTINKRKKIQEEIEKQENKTLAQNKLNYLNILHKILDDFIKGGFDIEIKNPKDLDTIIKACLTLQDAPTEITKNDNVNMNLDVESLFNDEEVLKILEEERIEEEKQKELLKQSNEEES